MPVRTARAVWKGNLARGKGSVSLGSGAFEGSYSFASRFEEGEGTNPEELIGAAHAGCFSMALAHGLAQAGYEPERVSTEASVEIGPVGAGFEIRSVSLKTQVTVEGIDEETFQNHAEQAKNTCPVSMALSGTKIHLDARLGGQEGEGEAEKEKKQPKEQKAGGEKEEGGETSEGKEEDA